MLNHFLLFSHLKSCKSKWNIRRKNRISIAINISLNFNKNFFLQLSTFLILSQNHAIFIFRHPPHIDINHYISLLRIFPCFVSSHFRLDFFKNLFRWIHNRRHLLPNSGHLSNGLTCSHVYFGLFETKR